LIVSLGQRGGRGATSTESGKRCVGRSATGCGTTAATAASSAAASSASGADIVIGNHPHWYQGVEVYKNKLITYAHGNYVFDQMWSEETREGVIGTYTFYDNQLVAASWKPLRIYNYGQAQWMSDSDSAGVLQTMEAASKTLAAKLGEPPT